MDIRVAVFIDFENIKRAVDEMSPNERVDIKRILDEVQRVTGGRIVLKRAYADWGAFKDYRSDLLDNATEPVQAFALNFKGKNGTDIRIAIDVMDAVLREMDISHVVLVSGDSDFTPLVMKLREFGKYVVGLGVRANTSNYLARACDCFSYYDDLPQEGTESREGRAVPSGPRDPVALLALALAALGNRPVSGSALKTQIRKIDPLFDEGRYGFGSFLEFLRAHGEIVDLYRPPIGDVTVAPLGGLAADEPPAGRVENGRLPEKLYPPAGAPVAASAADRYRSWLRDNNFRYVPSEERHQIMRVVYDIFTRAEAEGISLKEAKDRLHAWFEENRPSVSWESINSTVYHLFYTWCFTFDRSEAEDAKQLWDRRTYLQSDVQCADDLIDRCEKGIIRKIWERDREIDADALNHWLYDGDPDRIARVEDLVEKVAATPSLGRFSLPAASGGAVG